jgi:CxxC-x17-CxxC domain-containing protein
MHQGNWTCSGCSGTITELPFEPRRTDGLLCRECHQKQKGGDRPARAEGDRPRVEGDWKCSSCGTGISSLPFTPRDTSNLLCIDCYKKKKA